MHYTKATLLCLWFFFPLKSFQPNHLHHHFSFFSSSPVLFMISIIWRGVYQNIFVNFPVLLILFKKNLGCFHREANRALRSNACWWTQRNKKLLFFRLYSLILNICTCTTTTTNYYQEKPHHHRHNNKHCFSSLSWLDKSNRLIPALLCSIVNTHCSL